jgi:hypothetical protein
MVAAVCFSNDSTSFLLLLVLQHRPSRHKHHGGAES